jgi:excisionase family DNA binding protein
LESPVCYTRSEAAERLKVSTPTIDRLIEQGRLRAFRIGEKSVRMPGRYHSLQFDSPRLTMQRIRTATGCALGSSEGRLP